MSKHPETMALIHQILSDIGRKAKFIDIMTNGYRIKLGTSRTPEATMKKIQAELDANGYSDIKVKMVGSKYSSFGQDIGFSVPFIDDEVATPHSETKAVTKEIVKALGWSPYSVKVQKDGYLALLADPKRVPDLQKRLDKLGYKEAPQARIVKDRGDTFAAVFVPFIDDEVAVPHSETKEVTNKHIKESETTDYEEAGWELVNNAIDSFEYSDRQVDRIHIKAKDTGDTVIVHVTGMPKVAKKRLSDFIDDNLTKAGFEGTSRVSVFGNEITVELWK